MCNLLIKKCLTKSAAGGIMKIWRAPDRARAIHFNTKKVLCQALFSNPPLFTLVRFVAFRNSVSKQGLVFQKPIHVGVTTKSDKFLACFLTVKITVGNLTGHLPSIIFSSFIIGYSSFAHLYLPLFLNPKILTYHLYQMSILNNHYSY